MKINNGVDNMGGVVSAKKRVFGIFIVILISVCFAALFLFNPVRVPKTKHVEEVVAAVDVIPLKIETSKALIELYGTVKASKSVSLTSEVSGKIVWTSDKLIPGGFFKKGEVISKIESSDYSAAVVEQENSVAAAESALKIEKGKVSAAEKEFNMMGDKDNKDWERELMTRAPQLKSAETAFEAAKAKLSTAKLNLLRTRIKAPFNAVVIDKNADPGMVAGVSTSIAELAGTDSFWIELAVPVNQLKWIKVRRGDDAGSFVKIYNDAAWGKDVFRSGEIIELGGNLEENGRMARAIVEVKDPFSLEKENQSLPKMLVNMFVRVAIDGMDVKDIAVIPRYSLREGDKLWVVSENGTLHILSPEIVWKGRENIFIQGVDNGTKLITSQIGTPIEGLKLNVRGGGNIDTGESK